jgi:hypothetical protein
VGSSRCPGGALVVPWWCPGGALVVPLLPLPQLPPSRDDGVAVTALAPPLFFSGQFRCFGLHVLAHGTPSAGASSSAALSMLGLMDPQRQAQQR